MKAREPTEFEIVCARFYRQDPGAKVYASPSTGRVHIEYTDESRARFERPRGEATEAFAEWIKTGRIPLAKPSCWHCGVQLASHHTRPNCESCPDEICEDANCQEFVCAGSAESTHAEDVPVMTEFNVPPPMAIVNSVKAGASTDGACFAAFARTAGDYHERIRAWRVERRAAGQSQDCIDALSNDMTYLLNEAFEKAGEILDNEKVATPLGPVAVRLLSTLKPGEPNG